MNAIARMDKLIEGIRGRQARQDWLFLRDELHEIVRFQDAINELRDEEANSVTILCDNPEPPPRQAIVCNGDWTHFEDRRFEGDTVLECLEAALLAYRAQKSKTT